MPAQTKSEAMEKAKRWMRNHPKGIQKMPKIQGWSRDPFNIEGDEADFGPNSEIVRSWGEDNGSGFIEISKYKKIIGGDIKNGTKTVYNTSIIHESNNTYSNRKYETLKAAERRAKKYMKKNQGEDDMEKDENYSEWFEIISTKSYEEVMHPLGQCYDPEKQKLLEN